MRLAFTLFKYFPYGGLQRDFLRIALECKERGHEIHVYVSKWQGPRPKGIRIHLLKVRAISNHAKNEAFYARFRRRMSRKPMDCIIGFNRMPGLDVYYAADACFKEKASKKNKAFKITPRYKHYKEYEQKVFSGESKTELLMISDEQIPFFQKHYHTQYSRFHLLPPGISRDRRAPPDAEEIRSQFREEFGLGPDQRLMLMVGSGFKTKGLDRSIRALAALPQPLRDQTQLFVIGQDNATPFKSLADSLGVASQVRFLSGRDDVPRFLQGADLLIHPAYNENTGTVLLEAVVGGLPVLVTDVCGYAHYIAEADAGLVNPSPFSQETFNDQLVKMLDAEQRLVWRKNALAFAETADIYSLHSRAADIIERVAKRNVR